MPRAEMYGAFFILNLVNWLGFAIIVFMEIYFTDHARYQIKERNISPARVEWTIGRPDKTLKQSSGRVRAVRKFKKQRRVYVSVAVYEIRKHRIEIVTAFVTSKIKKYL
ncbi:MAG: hypothetical protein AAB722_01065 [Patescibacteria group bacterium]